MPSCIVKGCTHYTGMKTSNPLLTMHVFPRELGRIKLWLRQTGQDFGDVDAFAAKILDAAKSGKYRICSAHFGPGSYTAQGSRIVLKQDAIPTLFPGVYPKPPQEWKPLSSPAKKFHIDLDIIGKRDTPLYVSARAPEQPSRKREVGTQTDVECQQWVTGHNLHRSSVESPGREQLLDVNGRYVGVFCPAGAMRNELTPGPGQVYNLSGQSRGTCSDCAAENGDALSSLESTLVSLLQHLMEAPLTSRTQKQKTSRLLTQTAELISLLTGEEWTVVKKNAHISKFYQMIREVPIKCGDVAVFFTMDEWDYIEEHEERYQHVMLENPLEPKSLQSDTSCDGLKEDYERNCNLRLNHITDRTADIEDAGLADSPQHPHSPLPLITDKDKGKDKDIGTMDTEYHTAPTITGLGSDTPLRLKKESSSERCSKWEALDNSHDSAHSELWIAQDGTTSSQWTPQEDPRPPGRSRKTYSSKRSLLQCPVSLSCSAALSANLERAGSDSAESAAASPPQQPSHRLREEPPSATHKLVTPTASHAKRQRL